MAQASASFLKEKSVLLDKQTVHILVALSYIIQL